MKEKVVVNLTQVGKKISKSTNRAEKSQINRCPRQQTYHIQE